MRQPLAIVAAGLAAVIVVVLVALLLVSRHQGKPYSPTQRADHATPMPTGQAGTATATLPPTAPAGRDSTAEMVRAIERVTGAGRVQVTTASTASGRRVCILVDEPQRFYELDQGLTPGDFPLLEKAGFQAAPAPIVQTISIYRSLAKSAMGYSADAGDRIIVFLCPKAAWQELQFPWPEALRTPAP